MNFPLHELPQSPCSQSTYYELRKSCTHLKRMWELLSLPLEAGGIYWQLSDTSLDPDLRSSHIFITINFNSTGAATMFFGNGRGFEVNKVSTQTKLPPKEKFILVPRHLLISERLGNSNLQSRLTSLYLRKSQRQPYTFYKDIIFTPVASLIHILHHALDRKRYITSSW